MAKKVRLTGKGDDFGGTGKVDFVYGLGGNDKINGKGGDDKLVGGAGADRLLGGAGNDRLTGGAGNDTLTGGKGVNMLSGGSGVDTAIFKGKFADAEITEVNGGYKIKLGSETSTIKGVEFVKFGDGKVAASELIKHPPVISGIDMAAVAYDTGTGKDSQLFANFTVKDADGNLGAGTTLMITSEVMSDTFTFAADDLAMDDEGGNNVYSLANVVIVDGVGVATFADAAGVLTLTFNENSNADIIKQVARAVGIDTDGNHGPRAVSAMVTDASGAESDIVSTIVSVLPTAQPVFISGVDAVHDVTVVTQDDAAGTVTNGFIATAVTYVKSVGVANVGSVALMISLDSETAATDTMALPVALAGNGTVANIGGYLFFQTGNTAYNIGTVTGGSGGLPLVISLAASFPAGLSANQYDSALQKMIDQVTFDAAEGAADGVRLVNFTIHGIGDLEASAQAKVVVAGAGAILLTHFADTNETFAQPVDPVGINVFLAEAGTLQPDDNFSGGTGDKDILKATMNASGQAIGLPVIENIEMFDFSLQNGAQTSLDASAITNDNHDMSMKLHGYGSVSIANIGSGFSLVDGLGMTGIFELSTQDGASLQIVAAKGDNFIVANDSITQQAAIEVVANNYDLFLTGSAAFTLSGETAGYVDALGTSDELTIESVSADILIQTGSAAVAINDIADGFSATVFADLLADDTEITAAGLGDLNVYGLAGDVDAAGVAGDLFVETANIAAGKDVFIALGSGGKSTIDSGVTALDAGLIYIDAQEATGPIVLKGDASFNITSPEASLNATKTSGKISVYTVSSAGITLISGEGAMVVSGYASFAYVDVSTIKNTISFGNSDDFFSGDASVTGLGKSASGMLDATELDGALYVSSAGVNNSTIMLGAGVTFFDLYTSSNAANGVTVETAGFSGDINLHGHQNVVLNAAVGTINAAPFGSAAEYTGNLDVHQTANSDILIVAGNAESIKVFGGDTNALDGRGSVTIDAALMKTNTNILVHSSGLGVNTDVTIKGVLGDTLSEGDADIDLSSSDEAASTSSVYISTGMTAIGDQIDIVLGTAQSVSVNATGDGWVSIDAANAIAADFDDNAGTSDTNARIQLAGSSNISVLKNLADVDAATATGDITILSWMATDALALTTGSGNDSVHAGEGNDAINAGAGADWIRGGLGTDTLTGGNGADTFFFAKGDSANIAADHVTDFVRGTDVIDLSDYNLANGFASLSITNGSGFAIIVVNATDSIVVDGNFTIGLDAMDFIF